MATKRKRGKNKEASDGILQVPGLQELKKLWTAQPVRSWLALLQEIAPEYKWQLHGEGVIKGLCPYHDEKTPSFTLSFSRGFGKCFGCGKLVDDLVNFTARIKGCGFTEALLFLQRRFDLSEELGNNSEKLAAYNHVQEVKKQAAIAMREVLDELIRDNPDHLSYLRPALIHMTQGREIPINVLSRLPVGVYAKPQHLKKYIHENYHDGFDEYFANKYNNPDYWGGIVFHYNTSPGTISRFKLRKINRPLLNKHQENGVDIDSLRGQDAMDLLKSSGECLFFDDPYTRQTGVFGLHKYQRQIDQNNANVYLTEGEFDALSIMAAQEDLMRSDFVILGTSGQGALDVGFLKEYGVRTIWLVPDHPAKNGDGYAKSFLKEKNNFTKTSSGTFLVKVFQWPAIMPGGDIDEAVRLNGYEMVKGPLYAERTSTFLNSYLWVIDRCDKDVKKLKERKEVALSGITGDQESIEVAKRNIEDDTRRQIFDVLFSWFQYLHDPTERIGFTQEYQTKENINLNDVPDIHRAAYKLDTFDGCVEKIKDALSDAFEFAYYEKSGRNITTWVWSKVHGELVALPIHDQQLEHILALFVGQNPVKWVDKLLGEGSVLYTEITGDKPLLDDRTMNKNTNSMLRRALLDLIHQCKNKADLNEVGQGVHHFGLPADLRNKGLVYFVNGRKAFKGWYNDDSDMMEWEEITNAVDENLLFDLDPTKKWCHVEDVSDLYAANTIDLSEVYTKIRQILGAWQFENHEVTSEYLAAYIMALPVMAAFGNVNITYLTGDAESGKTSLLKGLLGGLENQGHDVKPILEAAHFASDATAAAMYQRCNRSSLLYIVDEAEKSENHNTEHDRRTDELLRIILPLPMGGASPDRGGQTSAQMVRYYIRMPVLMAGINIPTDTTLLSRCLVLYTQKDPGRMDIADYIREFFSEAEITELRKEITVCLLPYITQLARRRGVLAAKLANLEGTKHISGRFVQTMIAGLTIHELIGRDTQTLYRQILDKNKHRLELIHNQDNTSPVINACLYNEAIKISQEDGLADFVNARSLILKGEMALLNNSDCGVYYYAPNDWIVIVWRQALYTVLKNCPLGRMGEGSLKEKVAKNSHVIPEISMDMHKSIQKYLGLSDIRSPNGYTVVDATYLGVEEERKLDVESPEGSESSGSEVTKLVEDVPPVESEFQGGEDFEL